MRNTGGIRYVPDDLEYANMKAPVTPTAALRRIMGAKPPLPTKEGETFSQYSISAGLTAPTPAP